MSDNWCFKIYNYDIKIYKICGETDPCTHNVIINNESQYMNGREIYNLLQKLKLNIPHHFSEYVNEEDYGLFD